jgi:hypothetical protein
MAVREKQSFRAGSTVPCPSLAPAVRVEPGDPAKKRRDGARERGGAETSRPLGTGHQGRAIRRYETTADNADPDGLTAVINPKFPFGGFLCRAFVEGEGSILIGDLR